MSKGKNVYFLSTLDTNIGDEFIRDGLISVIASILAPEAFSWRVLNKHQPWTFYPKGHPAQIAGGLDRMFHRGWHKALNLLCRLPGNHFFDADLVFQSGTPIIWDGAYRSEWAIPFWRSFAEKNAGKIPLLNLGGGSCYPWSSPPDKLSGPDREFAKTMVHTSDCVTVRDPLAAKLLTEASGVEIQVLPCSAFLAGQYHAEVKKPDGRILLNIMPIGGHFDYLNQIDPGTWLSTVKQTVSTIPPEYRVEFICHNDAEKAFAEKHWPDHPAHLPGSPGMYFEFAAGATAAIVNRLHAAVGLSGLGIPCIAIGTDTRMLMTRQLEIPTLFVPETTSGRITSALNKLLENREASSLELLSKRTQIFQHYQEIIRPYLENTPFAGDS